MNCVKTYILKRYRFVYDSNGRTLDYINWNSGEPNNAGSGEDCVAAGHARENGMIFPVVVIFEILSAKSIFLPQVMIKEIFIQSQEKS